MLTLSINYLNLEVNKMSLISYPYQFSGFHKINDGVLRFLTSEDIFQIEAATGGSDLTKFAFYLIFKGYSESLAAEIVKAANVFNLTVPLPDKYLEEDDFLEFEEQLNPNQRILISFAIFIGKIARKIVWDKECTEGAYGLCLRGSDIMSFKNPEEGPLHYANAKAELYHYKNWDIDLELVDEVLEAAKVRIKALGDSLENIEEIKTLSEIEDFEHPLFDLQFAPYAPCEIDKMIIELEGIVALLDAVDLEKEHEYFLFKVDLRKRQERLKNWSQHKDLIVSVKESLAKRLVSEVSHEEIGED